MTSRKTSQVKKWASERFVDVWGRLPHNVSHKFLNTTNAVKNCCSVIQETFLSCCQYFVWRVVWDNKCKTVQNTKVQVILYCQKCAQIFQLLWHCIKLIIGRASGVCWRKNHFSGRVAKFWGDLGRLRLATNTCRTLDATDSSSAVWHTVYTAI